HAGDHVLPTPVAEAVLNVLDLVFVPLAPPRRVNSPVVCRVAVPVGGALPWTDRGQMRRLELGDRPLVHRVVRNTVQPDLAVAPGLGSGPLNAVVEVLRLARRKVLDIAGRAAGAP